MSILTAWRQEAAARAAAAVILAPVNLRAEDVSLPRAPLDPVAFGPPLARSCGRCGLDGTGPQCAWCGLAWGAG